MASPFRPCAAPSAAAAQVVTSSPVVAVDEEFLRLRVHLTPKSRQERIESVTQTPDGPALRARVRALPHDGKANRALVALVAKWLAVPKSSITVSSGAKSRTKVLTIIAAPNDQSRLIRQIDQLERS